jgi:hypothetical protein
MLNKKTRIVISSLGGITFTALLVAASLRRANHKSIQVSTLSGHISSKNNNNTFCTTSIYKQEEGRQLQSIFPRQGSYTVEVTMTATAVDTTICTSITNTGKDIAEIRLALAGVMPSPTEPSRTIMSAIIASPSHTPKEQEISISDEARKVGESLKELIATAIKEAKESAKGTVKRLKEETSGIAATTDSKDIQSQRSNVNALVEHFERMMKEIRKENYDEQIKLLQSYKDLLQTQIKVVKARGTMARKLKPGA